MTVTRSSSISGLVSGSELFSTSGISPISVLSKSSIDSSEIDLTVEEDVLDVDRVVSMTLVVYFVLVTACPRNSFFDYLLPV